MQRAVYDKEPNWRCESVEKEAHAFPQIQLGSKLVPGGPRKPGEMCPIVSYGVCLVLVRPPKSWCADSSAATDRHVLRLSTGEIQSNCACISVSGTTQDEMLGDSAPPCFGDSNGSRLRSSCNPFVLEESVVEAGAGSAS